MKKITVRFECVVQLNGKTVLDSDLFHMLETIKREHSIIKTSRILGVPYSRVWETVSKAEKMIGEPLLMTKRGGKNGGGANLTIMGEKLLKFYKEGVKMLATAGLAVPIYPSAEPQLSIAYSNDPLLAKILEKLSEEGVSVKGFCIGSGLSLAMLSLEEVDVACTHLYDPLTKSYNEPYLKRFWLQGNVVKLGGYERQLVMAIGENVKEDNLEKVIKLLLEGWLKLANRNRGSGTRVYLDFLLEEAERRVGARCNHIRGYEREHFTHEEVAEKIASGDADVGLVLRNVAEKYGLRWIHVTWERYEYYALKSRVRSKGVQKLKEVLTSSWLKGVLLSTPGYRKISDRVEEERK